MFEQRIEGFDEEHSDDSEYDLSSTEILDEMITHRGELKLRSSFNDKQFHVSK